MPRAAPPPFPGAVDVTGWPPMDAAAFARSVLRPRGAAVRISIQGARGSYSDEAASLWVPDRALVGCTTFAGAFDAVERGETVAAALPVWNSTIGAITEVLREFELRPVRAVSLVTLPIRHAVLAPPGPRPRTLYGHPKALLQCPKALAQRWPGVKLVEEDAASVAERWQDRGPEPHAGLLGNPHLAAMHGLEVLDPNMSDVEGNATTFALLVRRED